VTAITAAARAPTREQIEHRLVATELGELAHELRTPLNSVIGRSMILARGIHGPLIAEHAEYVDQIEAGGRHLLALVTSLLDAPAGHPRTTGPHRVHTRHRSQTTRRR
jgi:signal transduction histidine kinase